MTAKSISDAEGATRLERDKLASSGDGPSSQGLSDLEAVERLRRDGFNEVPSNAKRTFLRICGEAVREPMFLLLLVAGAVYLVLGDAQDAAMLLAFVFITIGITVFEEYKTERVLDALRDLSSPRALVIRNARQCRIPGREVVREDLLVLEEGDRVAADGVLVESHDLLVDESLLTGESVAVAKSSRTATDAGALTSEDKTINRIFSGTLVIQGGGLARVTEVGAASELGKIGSLSQNTTSGHSALQRDIERLVTRFSMIGIAISLLVFVLYGWTRNDWLNGFLVGVTLAMSLLPEEFTVILTVFMAMGAWRISKSEVLTRRMPVIEALGSATVLCVDKTGTVTENKMAVRTVHINGESFNLDAGTTIAASLREIVQYAVLASEVMPFDPMEKAFQQCLDTHYPHARAEFSEWSMVKDYALTRDCMAMTHVWRAPDRHDYLIATKGAPEAVARLCHMSEHDSGAMLDNVQKLAAEGLRVLAVAKATSATADWPASPGSFDFEWLGLVGLADPIRPEVRQSVEECTGAGLRVVMITGDYPTTAQAIARQAGLPSERVITGSQLDTMDARELSRLVSDVCVFARIRAEQKLRLVEAFKANGDIVAMTGDGVNDVPALCAAHIGISMGQRGTDVAREASSLVLLNDDFASIVRALRLGRRIYTNIGRALIFVVAAHIPIAGMTLLPVLLGTPIALAPVHIVFLEMIINPACALVFEAEFADRDVMKRPPRPAAETLFSPRSLALALLQGLGLLAGVAGLYFWGTKHAYTAEEVRSLTFVTLVIGNLALIVANRSEKDNIVQLLRKNNSAQWAVIASAVLALLCIVMLGFLRSVFHFAPLAPSDMLLSATVGAIIIGWIELVKLSVGRMSQHGKPGER